MIIREKNKIKKSNSRTKIAYQKAELELERLRNKLEVIQKEIDLLELKQRRREKALAEEFSDPKEF